MKVKDLNFDRIVDYLAVIVLIGCSLGYSKTELKRLIKGFELELNTLRLKLNVSTYDKIIGTDVRRKLTEMKAYI